MAKPPCYELCKAAHFHCPSACGCNNHPKPAHGGQQFIANLHPGLQRRILEPAVLSPVCPDCEGCDVCLEGCQCLVQGKCTCREVINCCTTDRACGGMKFEDEKEDWKKE